MNIDSKFEVATRRKYRFKTSVGQVGVEDLWDLTLEKLDSVYKDMVREQRNKEEDSLLQKAVSGANDLENKILIVKESEWWRVLSLNGCYDVDCIEGMKQIPSWSVDMIFCDLPYGVTARNKFDVTIAPELLWEQYERIIKPNGAILLFGQDKFTAKMMLSNEKHHRYNIIWEKTTPTGFLNARRMPLRTHEDIMVFYKSLPTYNPQKTTGHLRKISSSIHKRGCVESNNYNAVAHTSYDSTERFPTSVWRFPTDKQKSAIHPTQKPIDLCRYAIRTYSNEGDLILDNCCGSGSILLAAKLEGRNFIGMDNGSCETKGSKFFGMRWVDIARERVMNGEH